MASVCLYLQVHQPFRLRRYSVFDTDPYYFDDIRNAEICRKVTAKCYLPAGRLLQRLLKDSGGAFKVAFSITGTALDQFEAFAPEVIDLFKRLVDTGSVEILTETYHHSLAFMYSRDEFRKQVELHRRRVEGLFGQTSRVFRNTELIYSNDLAHMVGHMGFDGVLAEGADQTLGGRSPNLLYHPPQGTTPKLLLRNYRLSEDIAMRFGQKSWPQWPLTADKFAGWLDDMNASQAVSGGGADICNLFLDYQTFGEQQWAETGIFDFLEHLPGEVLKSGRHDFTTPGQALDRFAATGGIADVPNLSSWAEPERDVSAWLGNAMQSNAMHELYKLEAPIKAAGDEMLLEDWRRLTTSDHCFYMSTKFWAESDGYRAFNPYESPYDAYINYMNVIDNMASRVGATGRRM